MIYINIFHIIVVLFCIVLYVGAYFLIREYVDKPDSSAYIIANMVVTIFFVTLLFVVESNTKSAELEGINKTRSYNNEKMYISGRIKNSGISHINYCSLNVKVKDEGVNTDLTKLKNELFTQKTFMDKLIEVLHRKPDIMPQNVDETFSIDTNLNSGEFTSFSISVTMPSRFDDPKIEYKVVCH